ncbi:MAG: hypothetical protein AAGA85_09255 [Bacteroidota bacterium]
MSTLVQPQPQGFVAHEFTKEFHSAHTKQAIWKWLNQPETFTDTQVPPYRVEFYSPDPEKIPNGFNEGVLNIHHGPGINFAGVLTTIRPESYRDLQYFYGSYAFSLRWLRPYRLEFWVEDSQEMETVVKMKLSTWVKPWTAKLWTSFQSLFWSRFGRWMNKAITKQG